ncbi:MAG: FAD-binding oxidoreductase, partial [Deltaproteobacteria bacterium]|nr:FAD-binding oxidoreductase [Deltaproteobacteria bacterium]
MEKSSLSELGEILGDRLRTDFETRTAYSFDALRKKYLPDAVGFPVDTGEVQRIVQLANRLRFPVVPRGAGTGFSGGSLPTHGGLVLSMERMDRILAIDGENL